MKYETPELTALTPAISAIQSTAPQKTGLNSDGAANNESLTTYEDWE